MTYLGNSPSQSTILRVEARKSLSLGILISDPYGRATDLTDCTLTIVAKPLPIDTTSDAANLFGADAQAIIDVPTDGYARFLIQAESLDHPAKEYPYAIVLRTAEGYSSVIVKGTLVIEENTEYSSVLTEYSGINSPQSMAVLLSEQNVVKVYVGGQLPPGMNYVTDAALTMLDEFDPDSVAMVPPGGVPGYVLTKNGLTDYSMSWLPVGNGEFALDATGQPLGYAPVAVGDDTWEWGPANIDATGVDSGWAPVANGDGTWDWAQVTTAKPDWDADESADEGILNKPTLGTAAAEDVEAFYASDTLVSAMEGVHFVTEIPVSGTDGHLYFVYEE